MKETSPYHEIKRTGCSYNIGYELAETIVRNLNPEKWQFRDGVLEAAAKAIEGLKSPAKVADVLERVLLSYHITGTSNAKP